MQQTLMFYVDVQIISIIQRVKFTFIFLDIRLRGLLGSLIAIIVISAAIMICKFGSESYKRKKERRE